MGIGRRETKSKIPYYYLLIYRPRLTSYPSSNIGYVEIFCHAKCCTFLEHNILHGGDYVEIFAMQNVMSPCRVLCCHACKSSPCKASPCRALHASLTDDMRDRKRILRRKALTLPLLLRDRRRRDRVPSRENRVKDRERSASRVRRWSDTTLQRRFGCSESASASGSFTDHAPPTPAPSCESVKRSEA